MSDYTSDGQRVSVCQLIGSTHTSTNL